MIDFTTIIGNTYSSLTLIRALPLLKRHRKVELLCVCGKKVVAAWSNVVTGKTKSCGCFRFKRIKSGTKRWSLTVISEHSRLMNNGRILTMLDCKCICGKIVSVLKSSKTKSCGCIKRKFKDQHSSKLIRVSWRAMKERCLSPDNNSYHNYGAKGINICKRWMSFRNFYDDMLPSWKEGLTIDCYPNKKGNYEPTNCRWATSHQQAQNRTTNKLTDSIVRHIRGCNESAKVLAERYSVCPETISKVRRNIRWQNI